jgi:hypothetical protein
LATKSLFPSLKSVVVFTHEPSVSINLFVLQLSILGVIGAGSWNREWIVCSYIVTGTVRFVCSYIVTGTATFVCSYNVTGTAIFVYSYNVIDPSPPSSAEV